jgi:tetratricopeptide (TPR) repeat protein
MSKDKFITWAALVSVTVVALSVATAQTGNPQAANWFNRGLNEKDPQQKIEAYSRALQFDPNFVEALFNIGLVHMQQGNYTPAEDFFNRALRARQGQIPAKLKAQLHFYVAMIHKQTENWPACETHLVEAKKIVQDKATHVVILSELGRLYFKLERYEEALQELRLGLDLDKSNQSFFQNLIEIIEKEMALARLYREAEQAIAAGNIIQANSLLQQIKISNPNFKDVQAKISLTDSLLKARAEEGILNELYEQAARYAGEGALQNAISTYEILLQQSPGFKDAGEKLEAVKAQWQADQRTRVLAEEFAVGMEALAQSNWTRAIIAFERVLEIEPDHSNAQSKLQQANRGLQQESTDSIVSRFYADAVTAIERGESSSAVAALEKVRHLNPNFKDAEALLTKLEGEILKSTQSGVASPMGGYYKELFDDAIKSVDSQNWMQAVLKLEKLRVLKPDDPNVINLLTHARANLKLASSAQEKDAQVNQSVMIYFGGALAAILLLPAIGLFFFSATSRARFQFLRGNYVRAAQIYERYLTQHPNKVKLYVKLANIYLISGRDDDRALKVFKTIINLNLAPQMHPQINSILAQRYLTDGVNNSDAIAVLESALQAEQSKHNQVE